MVYKERPQPAFDGAEYSPVRVSYESVGSSSEFVHGKCGPWLLKLGVPGLGVGYSGHDFGQGTLRKPLLSLSVRPPTSALV